MTPSSLLPEAAAAVGISYPELCRRIIELSGLASSPHESKYEPRISNVRQRKKQQTLLDVKLRTSTERRRMFAKIFRITSKVIIFSVVIGGGWVGGKEALRRFVFENPDYAIADVKFVTDGTLTREQVLKTGDLSEGRNIFLVNLGRARTEIEKMPQVENVEVTRTLPNRLSVTVTERARSRGSFPKPTKTRRLRKKHS